MNGKEELKLPDFSDLHMLVVGDIMIDRYISGAIRRISPEAPVPIVEMERTDNRFGGAANVAINLHALGAKTSILSIIGNDANGSLMESMFDDFQDLNPHLSVIEGRKTTVKTRIMSGNQHILRIDNEDTSEITAEQENTILAEFEHILKNSKIDGVILQDYNKGMLTKRIIEYIIEKCNQTNIPTFVDPKENNFFSYKNCTIFKPNKKEAIRAIPNVELDYQTIDQILREKLHHQLTLITLGSRGLYLHDGLDGKIYPTSPRTISDVCGAGDTVISIVSLCYVRGIPNDQIAYIANTAGGQVCEEPGVVPINKGKLIQELNMILL